MREREGRREGREERVRAAVATHTRVVVHDLPQQQRAARHVRSDAVLRATRRDELQHPRADVRRVLPAPAARLLQLFASEMSR